MTAQSMATRLETALTSHDLDGLVALFAPDYRCEFPCHPERGFSGVDQVRKNQEQLFAGIPDVRWQLVGLAALGGDEWAEWEVTGTTRDGVGVHMCGITVIGVRDDRIAWARFYLEPVAKDGDDIDAAIDKTAAGTR